MGWWFRFPVTMVSAGNGISRRGGPGTQLRKCFRSFPVGYFDTLNQGRNRPTREDRPTSAVNER